MNSRSRKFACVVRVLRKGSLAVGNDRMLGDVADAGDHHHPGEQRQQPQQRIGPPHAGRGKACEHHGVDGTLRTELFPEMRGALRQRPFLRAERIRAIAPCAAGSRSARDIAQELAAIAHLRDRKRRRQHQIGIVLLLRARMMLQMIAAIGARLGEDRIGAEPLAQRQIGLLVRPTGSHARRHASGSRARAGASR